MKDVPHLTVLRFNATGKLLWAREAPEESAFGRMCVQSDTVYACGTARRHDVHGVRGDWYVLSFDPTGKRRWERIILGPNLSGSACQIAPYGPTVYVGGVFQTGDLSKDGHGMNLGAAKLTMDTGMLLWTRWQETDAASLAFHSMTAIEPGVQIAGTRTTLNNEEYVAIARFDQDGNILWEGQVHPPKGYQGLKLGATCGGLFGALLKRNNSLEYGDLLAFGVNGFGRLSYALVTRPAGTGLHAPRAVVTTDDSTAYLAALSFFPERPTLTVTRISLR